jgi:chromate transporter
MPTPLEIFISYFKVGLFTFGGGYAMLPVLMDEVVKNKHWFKEEEVLEGYAMAQLSVGIIAINTTTLLTARKFSRPLALIAAIATMLPSIILLSIIGLLLDAITISYTLELIFLSIQIGVGVLIAYTLLGLISKAAISPYGYALIVGIIILFLGFRVSSILIVACAIGLSVLWGDKL